MTNNKKIFALSQLFFITFCALSEAKGMDIFMIENPVMLGKLNKYDDSYTYTRYLGDIKVVDDREHDILLHMNGFNSILDIAQKCKCDIDDVMRIFNKYSKADNAYSLSDWNPRVNIGFPCTMSWKKTVLLYLHILSRLRLSVVKKLTRKMLNGLLTCLSMILLPVALCLLLIFSSYVTLCAIVIN